MTTHRAARADAHGVAWFLYALIILAAWGVQAFYMKLANRSMSAELIFIYMTITGLLLIPIALGMTDFTQPINYGWSGPWLAAVTQILNSIGALTLVFAFRYGKAIVVAPLTNAGAPLITAVISLLLLGLVPQPLKLAGILLAFVAARAAGHRTGGVHLSAEAYPGLSEQFLIEHGADRTAREIALQPQAWEQTQARAALAARDASSASSIRSLRSTRCASFSPALAARPISASAWPRSCSERSASAWRPSRRRIWSAVRASTCNARCRPCWCPLRAPGRARRASPPSNLPINASQHCHHLIITCNAEGALYRRSLSHPARLAVLLPELTHDLGFAMTASFSSMLYAALAIFRGIEPQRARIGNVARSTGAPHRPHTVGRSRLSRKRIYQRVVFLGSRGFAGLASEAALKLLELTDGAVVSVANTPLGFRHGPKTIVNRATLVVAVSLQ